MTALAPRFEDGRAFVVAGLGGRYDQTSNKDIPALWQRFGPNWFGKVPGQVDKRSYGVCYNMDGNGEFDYLAAVEVPSDAGLPVELTHLRIAPAHYAVFSHTEHISAIGQTWMGIFNDWLPKSGHQIARTPQFELYSETFNPQNAVGGVEIWIPLKP